ncbi:hypothetical protein [Methylobacterium persicinum]|uniref:Uncharacterized protein n=1 Tax=Methylobacterium persicinum TaxID=374426 RepID=A0ABU0HLD3_9HYPH|nr:hypothetical protein [Methylobacterium persicinum]MDQ0443131.1 hypothetical protein [Methylobacterium persicinum]GJE38291.1 hypothetical protein KHHGKMAE_2361 [Methylobacterium persicinum]
MRRFVTSSRARRRILVLGAVLAAAPALAQAQPATGTPEKGAAGTPRAGRAISATGRTMPPPRGAGQPAVAGEAAMAKAQKEAEARSKAWDSKMHKTMSTICNGC